MSLLGTVFLPQQVQGKTCRRSSTSTGSPKEERQGLVLGKVSCVPHQPCKMGLVSHFSPPFTVEKTVQRESDSPQALWLIQKGTFWTT